MGLLGLVRDDEGGTFLLRPDSFGRSTSDFSGFNPRITTFNSSPL